MNVLRNKSNSKERKTSKGKKKISLKKNNYMDGRNSEGGRLKDPNIAQIYNWPHNKPQNVRNSGRGIQLRKNLVRPFNHMSDDSGSEITEMGGGLQDQNHEDSRCDTDNTPLEMDELYASVGQDGFQNRSSHRYTDQQGKFRKKNRGDSKDSKKKSLGFGVDLVSEDSMSNQTKTVKIKKSTGYNQYPSNFGETKNQNFKIKKGKAMPKISETPYQGSTRGNGMKNFEDVKMLEQIGVIEWEDDDEEMFQEAREKLQKLTDKDDQMKYDEFVDQKLSVLHKSQMEKSENDRKKSVQFDVSGYKVTENIPGGAEEILSDDSVEERVNRLAFLTRLDGGEVEHIRYESKQMEKQAEKAKKHKKVDQEEKEVVLVVENEDKAKTDETKLQKSACDYEKLDIGGNEDHQRKDRINFLNEIMNKAQLLKQEEESDLLEQKLEDINLDSSEELAELEAEANSEKGSQDGEENGEDVEEEAAELLPDGSQVISEGLDKAELGEDVAEDLNHTIEICGSEYEHDPELEALEKQSVMTIENYFTKFKCGNVVKTLAQEHGLSKQLLLRRAQKIQSIDSVLDLEFVYYFIISVYYKKHKKELKISLVCIENYQKNNKTVIDLSEYCIEEDIKDIEDFYSKRNMKEIANTLSDEIFIENSKVCFKNSLLHLINKDKDAYAQFQIENMKDADVGEGYSVHLDYSIDEKEKLGTNDILEMECADNAQKRKASALIQKIWRGRMVREKYKASMTKKIKFLYKTVVKLDDHYISITVILNYQTKKAEVLGYDFNTMKFQEKLILPRHVLTYDDLNQKDLLKKILINLKERRIEITEFYHYKMKEKRILKNLDLSHEDIARLVKFQAVLRGILVRRKYLLRKKYEDKINYDKNKHRVLSRFVLIYSNMFWLVVVKMAKNKKKIMVEGFCKNRRNLKTSQLDLNSNEWKDNTFTNSFLQDLPSMTSIKSDNTLFYIDIEITDIYKKDVLTNDMKKALAEMERKVDYLADIYNTMYTGYQIPIISDQTKVFEDEEDSDKDQVKKVQYEELRDSKNDKDFMSDELYYGKVIYNAFQKSNFRKKAWIALNKRRNQWKAITSKAEVLNEEVLKRDLTDTAHCVLLVDDRFVIKGFESLIKIKVFYDLRFSDFIVYYGHIYYKNQITATFQDFGQAKKDLRYVQNNLRFQFEQNFIKWPNRESEIISKRELKRLLFDNSKRSMRTMNFSDIEEEMMTAKKDQQEQLLPDSTMHKIKEKMINYPMAKYQYLKAKEMTKSKYLRDKLVWKTMKVDRKNGYLLMFFFLSDSFCFKFKAKNIDTGEIIVEVMITFESFIKIFSLVNQPFIDEYVHSEFQTKRFKKEFLALANLINIVKSSQGYKIRFDYSHNNLSTDELNAMLLSVKSKESRPDLTCYQKKKKIKIDEESMTPHEKQVHLTKAAICIQKCFKAKKNQEVGDLYIRHWRKPIILIRTAVKRCSYQYVSMNFQHQKFQKNQKIVFTIYYDDQIDKFFSICDYTHVLQQLFPDDWDQIDQLTNDFSRNIIPDICDSIVNHIDVIKIKSGYRVYYYDDMELTLQPVVKKYQYITREVEDNVLHEQRERRQFTYGDQMGACIKIQNLIRRCFSKMSVGILAKRKVKDIRSLKKYGVLMSKTIKRLGSKFYYVKLFEKKEFDQTNIHIYLINVADSNDFHKLTFNQDDNQLLNTDGQVLTDYLIEKLSVNEDGVPFLDLPIDPEYIKVVSQPGDRSDKTELARKQSEKGIRMSHTMKGGKKIAIEMFDVGNEKLGTRRDTYNHKSQQFNIYYDKLGKPIGKESGNYLQVEIDIDKLKKSEPNQPTVHDKEGLKRISQHISQCLKIDEKGDIQVDKSKLDPSSVSILDKHLMNFSKDERIKMKNNRVRIEELDNVQKKNTENLTLLSKATKLLNNIHYLFIISKKEIIVGGNEIDNDTYEVFFSFFVNILGV